MMTVLDDEAIARLFKADPTFAMVGASSSPERDSFDVMDYLLGQGFRVLPVNPTEGEVLGLKAFASLAEVPDPVDVVLVFRRSSHAAEVTAEAVTAGAKIVWLTLGVTSAEAAALAAAAGLGYVEDRCAKATHKLMRRTGML